MKLLKTARPYLFISPTFVFLAITTLYPIIYVVQLSFTDWKLINPLGYIGVRNFVSFFTDTNSLRIIGVTVFFLIGDLLATIVPGFIIALVLNQNIRIRGFLRAMSLIPWAVSAVIAGVIWKWLLEPELGVLTYFLSSFGVKIDFFSDPVLSLLTVIFVDAWRGIGYAAVFILAGLQGIDPELVEASKVDGAGIVQRFLYITLPLLKASLLILVILLTIHALNTVDIVMVVTGGGPSRMTETVAFHMYKEGMSYFNIGYSSAVGVILLVVNIVLAVIYFKTIRPR